MPQTIVNIGGLEWPSSDDKDTITISQLATNTGGVLHYATDVVPDDPGPDYDQYTDDSVYNPLESVAIFKARPLAFTPGSDYLYTSFGFNTFIQNTAAQMWPAAPFHPNAGGYRFGIVRSTNSGQVLAWHNRVREPSTPRPS